MIAGFLLFALLFTAIGAASSLYRKPTAGDYLVAGRSVNPWMTALSAVATNNSGFMFIGLIGTTYFVGVSAMWLMVGWIVGDYLAWLTVHRRVRERAEETGALTVPSLLSAGVTGNRALVTAVAGLITVAFLMLYAAAQLKAGSKALHVLFGWHEWTGASLGAGIVLIYCVAGGIRASIWTDVAQSAVMILAMAMLLVTAVVRAGGAGDLWESLRGIDPALVDPIPADLRMGFALYLLGWVTAGIGVVGQPHIMVRLLALDEPSSVGRARRIYVTWYALFSFLAIAVGLASRFFIQDAGSFDGELALPTMAKQLLPGFLAGVVLAGLFAATMSTADSQILSISAAVTQDVVPAWRNSYVAVKIGTVVITAAALGIALMADESVFQLVVDAWAALASGLGPLLIVQAFGRPPRAGTALGMMAAGLAVMHAWTLWSGLNGSLYSVFPGMIAGFLVYAEFELSRPRRAKGRSRRAA